MTDLSTMERALGIIAVSLAVQTVLMVGLAVAGYLAYRRTTSAFAKQLADLHVMTQELSVTVNRAADSVSRGAQVVTSAIDDARHSANNVGMWLSTAATVVTKPRTAAAVGVLRAADWWQRRRRAAKVARATHPI
jgi:hypothetical protein